MSSQANEEPTQVGANTTQAEANATQEEETQAEPIVGRKRKKTSVIWKDFDEKEITKGVFRAVCKHCKAQYTTGTVGSSTSQMTTLSGHVVHHMIQNLAPLQINAQDWTTNSCSILGIILFHLEYHQSTYMFHCLET